MQWADHGRVVTLANGQCECGLRPLARQSSCATRRDRLFARDFEQPVLYWRFHRLAVDAYCLQHESYINSAKSFAAHLGGLSIAFEHGNDPGVHRSLIQWLNGDTNLRRPQIPALRGRLTIAHVEGIDNPILYGTAVEEWARSVWEAYRDLRAVAREWVAR